MEKFLVLLLLFLLSIIFSISAQLTDSPYRYILQKEDFAFPSNQTRGLKIAFCLTGQLARLELQSKLKHIFFENAKIGNIPHLFVYLDNDVSHVKQTYWNYDYSNNPFSDLDRKQLKSYIDKLTIKAGFDKDILRTRVLLHSPSREVFHVVNGEVPVNAKEFSGHDGPKDNYESAAGRFQNNMRWMAGLRECVKWVQLAEFQQKWFYDLVVRLRDDSFALGPWKFGPEMKGKLTSSSAGNFRGVNDHNFVVDRGFADSFLRGLTEDYYFNQTLSGKPWGNAEGRIRQLALSLKLPLQTQTLCSQPLMPLRGLENHTHWRFHPLYVRVFKEDCEKLGCCSQEARWWVQNKAAPVNLDQESEGMGVGTGGGVPGHAGGSTIEKEKETTINNDSDNQSEKEKDENENKDKSNEEEEVEEKKEEGTKEEETKEEENRQLRFRS